MSAENPPGERAALRSGAEADDYSEVMGAQLRVVLDQLAQVVDPDVAEASLGLASGLIATAPHGCDVEAITCGGDPSLPGLARIRSLGRSRAQIAASWQLGIAPGVGGGLIHAPSLMAPLVRHDRANDHDQTVITLWDLRAWEAPSALPKTTVAWQRAMLRRAVKHADAVVVPTHSFIDRLAVIAGFGDRVRVIAGAPPRRFAAPADAAAVRSELGIPGELLVASGTAETLAPAFRAAAELDLDVLVLDVPEGQEPKLADAAAAAGLAERRMHARGALSPLERAAALSAAQVHVATDPVAAWPWRTVEAMALGVPTAAIDTDVNRDVLADGGTLADAADLAEAAISIAGDARAAVLAGDRGRAFSWGSTAERVWALHADL